LSLPLNVKSRWFLPTALPLPTSPTPLATEVSVPSSNIMKLLAVGPDGRSPQGERKVRTPQSSVPDNVREAGFKPSRRKVPQKTYRLARKDAVRVKRCGKSAPPRQ